MPVALITIMCLVAALPCKRKATPQEWADELETHLLNTEGRWDWDDATSVVFADVRLENLRCRLALKFNCLETAGKRENFRLIVEALRRGEIPEPN